MVSHRENGTSSRLEPPTGGARDHRARSSVLSCQDVSNLNINSMCEHVCFFKFDLSYIHDNLCLLPASSAVSSFSKTKESRRTVQTPSKQDTGHDESDLQSTKVTEVRTTTPQPRSAAPVNRRVRPLSQSRSYHGIFSSVRGSVRNKVNSGSSRGRVQDREEEEEEEKITTTASPVEETTTMETKEPDNDVSPEFEDEVGYDEVPLTTETPRLKVSTPSPIKPRPNHPPRRPIKIRVHKKPISKDASSSSPSLSSATSPASSSSFDSSLSSTSSSRIQESAANRKNYVASSYPKSKDTYDKPSISHTKPSSTVVKETNSQQTDATSVGGGLVPVGRTKGAGLGSRYGYGRRLPGNVFRGNSTRILNGKKPAVTSQLNLPSRTRNQGTSNTQSSATSQSTLPDRRSPVRDATYREGNDDIKNKDTEVIQVEEPTSSSKPQPTEEERGEGRAKAESSNDKSVVSRTRISPSFAERFPWLVTRYPGMFGSGTRASSPRQEGRASLARTSSSMGDGRPILRGTPTRVSGATGAAGVSMIQVTSDNLRTHDSLKNGVGVGSVKPSLTNTNTASSDTRNPTTSSSSSSSSLAATSSNSDSHYSSSRRRASNEPVPRATANNNNNDHNEDYLDEKRREISGKNDNVALTSADRNSDVEDNDSVDTKKTFSSTRPASPSGGSQSYRRPGVGGNGRGHSPLLAKRHFGGSWLPIRTQPAQNSRMGSSASDSSSSSSDSSSSNSPVWTSDRDVGSHTTVTKTGGLIGGNSQSASSSSASSSSSRGQGGRPRYPIVRGKPTNGGQLKPNNGNGKVHVI